MKALWQAVREEFSSLDLDEDRCVSFGLLAVVAVTVGFDLLFVLTHWGRL